MKKVIAFMCAVMLTLGMTATLYAAPSVTVSGIVTEITETKDANGNAVDVTINEVPEQYTEAVQEIKSEDTLKEVLGDAYEEGMQVVDVKNITVPEGTAFPVTLTFKVAGVTESSSVAVLHFDTAAGVWETVDSKAGNGTITATFTSLSPVAFVVDQKTAASVSGAGSNGQTPSTGDAGTGILPTVLIAVAALAGAGLILFSRKKRA
ncbi:MAG: LPXTG cell wall anchor domain-containing protein [Lachnospiraceae bacterium]|nr:LPXTG cell wall anchor domain-containing protein [Lachnospiraceae bacterium]